ncbi:hypothetical protein RHGRI_014306 [Rhododendron griersonianum]|uniref:Lactate/malate dehydrogenase C-terminal domain-containing protein n=1 Tax=Rhododendron griersonianum TaxID=479676 RepID=A0AAV6K972_9ERIC|nr:hypothetical protein RHGRI_014306 [Rhododendron griersonianum]
MVQGKIPEPGEELRPPLTNLVQGPTVLLGLDPDKVLRNFAVWTVCYLISQVPDFLNARINGLPVKEVISNVNWSEEEFSKKVQKRGEVLIQKWGRSSGASTAFSIVDAIRSLVTPTPKAIDFLLE